ncbi:MAG: hypothetical protein ACRCSN_17025 [Dermatophilaceae bacterium]
MALAALLAGPAATSAAASGTPDDDRAGWERLVAAPFTSPAGDLCPFELRSEPVFDQVYTRITKTYADGSPKRQEYSGPLVVRLTNSTSGESIQRDLSGRAVATYAPDGGFEFRIQGPAAVGFRAYRGDSLPTGYYVLRGTHVVSFAADGARTLTVDRGTEENVCQTLS